jgi:tetratricopeptide (TPR) repeat protein
MQRKLALLLALGPLLAAERLHAEPRDPAGAEVLFEAGRDLLDAGDYETACAKFAESHRLDPGAGTLMNWASCEEKLGKTASAWQHLKEALDSMPPRDDRVAFARAKLRELEARLPWLTVRLEASSGQVTVLRDGVALEAASLGMALPVDPGDHSILVRAEGHADQEFTVHVEEQEKKELSVHPGAALSKPSEPKKKKTPVLGWSLVGAGTASIGLGVATAVMLNNEQQTVDEHCDNKRCDETGVEAAARGERLIWANAIAFGAGATALGTGIVLILTNDKESERPVARKVTAAAQPNGGFVSYGGSF